MKRHLEETLVEYETAILAHEIGFVDIIGKFRGKNYYNHKGELNGDVLEQLKNKNLKSIPAPTQSLLQKFLREAYKLHIKVDDFLDDEDNVDWDFEIVIIGTDLDENGYYNALVPYSICDDPSRRFKTFEKALEEGLQEAMKIIKDEKH